MYLEKYIGHYVTFSLSDLARAEKTMEMFYRSNNNADLIRNKLVAVDQLGMWVEGFQETTILVDDEGNNIENPKKEWITYHVLVRWEYVEGVFVVDNPELNEKRIGY